MYIQTPKQIAEKHNMPNANVMHVEMVIDQMFMFRPLPELSEYATPLPGLYMANAGQHPGGGIFGAPGYNCAHEVRKSLRRRFR
jgi:phytoene dehydrogenase-like protein